MLEFVIDNKKPAEAGCKKECENISERLLCLLFLYFFQFLIAGLTLKPIVGG